MLGCEYYVIHFLRNNMKRAWLVQTQDNMKRAWLVQTQEVIQNLGSQTF